MIVKEYFSTYDISDQTALKAKLATMLESFPDYKHRFDTMTILQALMGAANVTKLILACEVGEKVGDLHLWIKAYPLAQAELNIPSAGTTPLISTIRNFSKEIEETLFAMSPDVNLPGSESSGCTPLIAAAQENNPETIRTLISRGASLELADTSGYTPLHHAAATGSYAAAHALLAAGANPNSQTLKGQSPLYVAILAKSSEMVRLLLRHWADPNLKTQDHISPLLNALYVYLETRNSAKKYYLQELSALETIMKLLLCHARIKAHDPGLHGITPLSKAYECALSDIVSIIQQKTPSAAQRWNQEKQRSMTHKQIAKNRTK